MGQSTAETVREIEDTRNRIEADLRELEDRLPAPAVWTKRLAGFAVGGGVGAATLWFAVKRVRGKKKKKAAANVPVNAVIQVLPEGWADRIGEAFEGDEWKTWVAGAAGVWLLFRLAELRQLRRMNRALLPTVR